MIKELKIPEVFKNAAATKTQARAKVEAGVAKVLARIDMSAEVAGAGLCPECKKPMENAFANGIPTLICREHRISIPTPDEPKVE